MSLVRDLLRDNMTLEKNIHRTVLGINRLLIKKSAKVYVSFVQKTRQCREHHIFAPIARVIIVENVIYFNAYGRGVA